MDFDFQTSLNLLEEEGYLFLADPCWRDHMHDLLWSLFSGDEVPFDDDDEDGDSILYENISASIDQFVGGVVPPRSTPWYPATHTRTASQHAQNLVDTCSGEQRNEEWFARRHCMITASNAWKIVGSDASKRSLIWEKLQPIRTHRGENIMSATHWGERYEDVAALLYERDYGGKVSFVGCIPHPEHSFIGASPDGIVVDAGRGLEIKCVVSREITGVPTKAYWVQMQWQAEVMGLNEIDFLECKFAEYASREEATDDGTFTETASGQPKGTMHHFHGPNGTYYVHAPLSLSEGAYERWSEDVINQNINATWVCARWWKLEDRSCVTVPRHPGWFRNILPLTESLWNKVLHARIHGGDEFKPAKRKRATAGFTELNLETIPLCVYSDEE